MDGANCTRWPGREPILNLDGGWPSLHQSGLGRPHSPLSPSNAGQNGPGMTNFAANFSVPITTPEAPFAPVMQEQLRMSVDSAIVSAKNDLNTANTASDNQSTRSGRQVMSLEHVLSRAEGMDRDGVLPKTCP